MRTRDHSPVQLLMDLGEIDESEMATHPAQNRLYRCLGGDTSPKADLGQLAIQTGDLLVLCSDGVWEHVPEEELWDAVRASGIVTAARHLTAQAVQRGGAVADNATLILLRAEAAGANEALLVGPEGIVREGAWSNIFWLDALGVLFTPAENLLPGCIREMIFRYGPVKQGNFSTAELLSTAAEVFITKSTVGIIPVCSIDEVNIGGQNTEPQNASPENKNPAVCRLQQWLQEISLQ